MTLTRSILTFAGLAVLATAVTAAIASRSDDEPVPRSPASAEASGTKGEPVILRVNRNMEVRGHIELEDDDVIVVRTPRGQIESFSKARVGQIVRLVKPEPEQRGIVYLRNGQVREGIIVNDEFDHVTIEIEGVRARLRRDVVSHVVLKPTFEQQYQEFKATLAPGAVQRHLTLCRWLFENRRYELAQAELNELLDGAVQDVPEARQLLRIVEAQLALQPSASREPTEVEPREVEEEAIDRGRILSHEEVNLMKVYEIDFHHPPRVAVGQGTIRRMIEKYSANPTIPSSQSGRNALFRADPLEIVRMLFQLRAREMYGEVQVLTEPHSLNLYRRVHDGWLMQSCATSACHGGSDAGNFMLHRAGRNDERVRATNLLILERLEVHPEHRLINYQNPEMSLLVQYALPTNVARIPHPEVPGWRPAFTRHTERMNQDTIRWIKSMMQPRPDYGIEYEPPKPHEGRERDVEDGEDDPARPAR